MKSNRILFIFYSSMLVLLAACTKPIEFSGEVTESQVVLQSRITAGDSIKVRLCWSRFFLDAAPFRMIDNATLQLTVNGSPMPAAVTYSQSDARYTIAYLPMPGDTLSIVALVPNHEPVSSTTIVPAQPAISGATSTQTSQSDYDLYTNAEYAVRFRLDDPEDQQNYYAITITATINQISLNYNESHITSDTTYYFDTTYTYNADTTDSTMVLVLHTVITNDTLFVFDTIPIELNLGFTCRDYLIIPQDAISLDEENTFGELYFTDANINGLSHEIQLTVPVDAYYFCAFEYEYLFDTQYQMYDPNSLRIIIEVTSFSRDLYLYDQTTSQQEDEFGGIISEPVQIHSNIDGGYGIFAACSSVRIPVTNSTGK